MYFQLVISIAWVPHTGQWACQRLKLISVVRGPLSNDPAMASHNDSSYDQQHAAEKVNALLSSKTLEELKKIEVANQCVSLFVFCLSSVPFMPLYPRFPFSTHSLI